VLLPPPPKKRRNRALDSPHARRGVKLSCRRLRAAGALKSAAGGAGSVFRFSLGVAAVSTLLAATSLPSRAATGFGTTVINGKTYQLPPPPVGTAAGAALIIPDSPNGPITSPGPVGPAADPPAPESGQLPQPLSYFSLGGVRYAMDEILVRFSPLAGTTARQQVMDKYGIKALFHIRAVDTYVMAVPKGADPQSLVAALKAEPAIKDAGARWNPGGLLHSQRPLFHEWYPMVAGRAERRSPRRHAGRVGQDAGVRQYLPGHPGYGNRLLSPRSAAEAHTERLRRLTGWLCPGSGRAEAMRSRCRRQLHITAPIQPIRSLR